MPLGNVQEDKNASSEPLASTENKCIGVQAALTVNDDVARRTENGNGLKGRAVSSFDAAVPLQLVVSSWRVSSVRFQSASHHDCEAEASRD